MNGEHSRDDLSRQLSALQDQFAIYQRDQEYLQSVADMKRAWLERGEDNVDASHPLVLDLYIPPETKKVKRAFLRLRLKPFRAYSTGAASGGGAAVTSSASGVHRHRMFALEGLSDLETVASAGAGGHGHTTDSAPTHNHGVTGGTLLATGTSDPHPTVTWVESGAHSHATDAVADHTHTYFKPKRATTYHALIDPGKLQYGIVAFSEGYSAVNAFDLYTYDAAASHDHAVAIPSHTHGMTYGIYASTTASAVQVAINGTNRTAALGGPFSTDADSLDITQYLTPTGWNTVELGSATLGRLGATAFVELYLP